MTVISATGNQALNTLVTSTKSLTAVTTAASQQQASTAQSTTVMIGQADTASPVYNITKPALVWERSSSDLMSSKLASNFSHSGNAARFTGLGAALLERFTTDSSSYSQSVMKQTSAQSTRSAANVAAQTQLHTKADNQISLSIKTASGALVDITLGSDDDGLGVQVNVSKGTLSDADRKALAGLAEGFQKAIDGLTAQPPKLDLSGMTKFDTSVLSSVDLHATLGTTNTQTLDFHADANTRSVKSTGVAGTVDISVDMSKRALLGTESQQKQALNSYLKQISSAGNRDESLMNMFKDAFTALNCNYGETATTYKSGGAEPVYFSLTKTDKNMMTGLADFTASVSQTPVDSTNPMRPDETDTFSYQVSQTSTITGTGTQDRNITQKQQSHLAASYHASLTPGLKLNLTSDRNSQNYLYYQIDDKAESTTSVQYHKGALMSASVAQSSSNSTHIQKYVKGALESDITTPEITSKTTDLLGTLQSAWENNAPRMSFRDYLNHQTLPDLSGMVLMESDAAQLKNSPSLV